MGRIGDLVRRGMFAPIRALLPKNPWLRFLIYALPVVLLLALFRPALDLVLELLRLGIRLLEPLLQTTIGRIVLLIVVFTLGAALAVWLLKNRVREMRGEAVLGRHLLAIGALVGQDTRRCRELFRRVARYRGPAPDRFPHVVADGNLKLARLALDSGQVEAALGWLARVVEPGLPDELVRSLLQLRVRVLALQGEVLPAALRAEIERAVERFPKDYRLLGELRDVLPAAEVHEIAAVQERVVKVAPPAAAARERQRLLDLLDAAGQRALADGADDVVRKVAKKLAGVDKDGARSGLLLGDLQRKNGELRAAAQAYGATRSPAGLDRLAELLCDHPGAVEPRELLQFCPLEGTLLLVARELARQGNVAAAERAARRAAEALGPTPTVCAVLAEVLGLLGQEERARLLREQAIARLLAPPA